MVRKAKRYTLNSWMDQVGKLQEQVWSASVPLNDDLKNELFFNYFISVSL